MNCKCCPFECGVDRESKVGICRAPGELVIAKMMAHFWEEPCISGTKGSGAIFFSFCNSSCHFCQNHEISHFHKGEIINPEAFISRCKELINISGVHNLNFVSPTHYSNQLLTILPGLKEEIKAPIVWNSNGYEKEATIQQLEGLVDIFLPDFKYFDKDLAMKFSHLPDYFLFASQSVTVHGL